ncbi:hypothetical protein EA658_13330 [Pseudoxanthomonas winnipegensis]|jgi:hypothetical protein|uniref:DUF6265 domain-containing protein n=2 Tax=Pseudoxanthomonas winnipegensis TaxID=2480810 RepID=A0ABY1WEL9_9GAMM|nr:hypothetical protein EA659_00320 [Pseudoxanthomonas winnipegensis]TAA19798.1 hypothetical protein EA658_13330 [Pseudoxanthomonas winnipegensis]TAH70695.1 hypothetical protein EA657_16115 [Pseudoxanthomonas winnipegensis]
MRMAATMMVVGLGMWSGAAQAAAPDLAWLSGRWCGGEAGRVIEEAWLAPVGGELIGMSRTVKGEATQSFEFMRIVREGEGLAMHVEPNGETATVFALVASGPGWIRFGNPAHDFPNTIEYRRQGERLNAWIAGPGPDGKPLRIDFDYTRCAS